MAVLTDTDLQDVLCKEETWRDAARTLHIHPYDDKSLTPVGYDLRVGERYSSNLRSGMSTLGQGGELEISPGETVLVTTLESIGMPRNKMLSAFVCSRVSLVAKGLSHISTTVDADWVGPLLIAVTNQGRSSVSLPYGERLATVVFLNNNKPASRSVNRPPSRHDLYMSEWENQTRAWKTLTRRAALHDRLVFWSRPVLVMTGLGLGLGLLGSTPGAVAAVAVSVALSQMIGGSRSKVRAARAPDSPDSLPDPG